METDVAGQQYKTNFHLKIQTPIKSNGKDHERAQSIFTYLFLQRPEELGHSFKQF
jgi:hypothetical protein